MKKPFLFFYLIIIPFCSFAQQNIFSHVWWEATGSYDNDRFGAYGLDTLGKLNDTIPHAISIGAADGIRMAYNRDHVKADTAPHGFFPGGSAIVPGDINGDGIKDYVVLNEDLETVTVLFGTDTIGKFDTAMVLHGEPTDLQFTNTSIVVAPFDSTRYDGIVISDINGANETGRLLYYRGGTILDTIPTEIVTGISRQQFVGGYIATGHIRDKSKECLVETRSHGKYADVFLYPFGHGFTLTPSDTFTINEDTNQAGFMGSFVIADADGDGIDDMILGSYSEVLIYKGGETINPHVTYLLHPPPNVQVASFAVIITDVGDITGRGYHTIVVSYPTDSNNGYLNGAVYLYNLNVGNNAPKDECVADGFGPVGFEDSFGETVIASGNANGLGQYSFMVGRTEGTAATAHSGALTAFWGDTSFGPMVGVREDGSIPVVFSLGQNYPNPFSGETNINFSVLDPRLYGSSATLTLYNEFGEKVKTLYSSTADNIIRSLHFNAEELPSGNYFYRLECGGRETTRMLTILQ